MGAFQFPIAWTTEDFVVRVCKQGISHSPATEGSHTNKCSYSATVSSFLAIPSYTAPSCLSLSLLLSVCKYSACPCMLEGQRSRALGFFFRLVDQVAVRFYRQIRQRDLHRIQTLLPRAKVFRRTVPESVDPIFPENKPKTLVF